MTPAPPRPERRTHAHAARARQPATLLLLYAALCMGAQGAEEPPPDAPISPPLQAPYRVVPRLTVSETLSDNINLSGSRRLTDQVTEVSPGIFLERNSGPLRGYLDYALRGVVFAQNTHPSTLYNALNSAAQLSALDDWLFIDFSGTIAQQSLLALGTQARHANYGNVNSTEVSTFRLAPGVRGHLGGVADYVARVARTITHSNSGDAGDIGESQASLDFNSPNGQALLGWLLHASRRQVDYSAGRGTEADELSAGVSLHPWPQFSAEVRAGRESSNYTTLAKETFATHDALLRWQPTPQAQASASWGRRSFGDTRALSLEYRSPLLVLSLSDRRDVSVVPGLVLPVLFITDQGVPLLGRFVTTALALQERQDISLSLLGVRDTLTLALSQSDTTRIDSLSRGQDELLRGTLRQSAASLAYSHRLSPRYQFDASVLAQNTRSSAANQPEGLLRQVSLGVSGKLWRQGRAALTVRHADYRGETRYDENTLSFSVTAEF